MRLFISLQKTVPLVFRKKLQKQTTLLPGTCP
jgi:hypothetical protein